VLLLGGQGARFPSVAGDLSAQRLSPLAVLPDLGVEVLRADQALPRAYLAASGRLIEATGGPAAFTGWLAGGGTAAELRRQAVVDSSELLVAGRRVFDHQQVARLTGRLLASPPAAGPPPAPTAGSARILVYESSRVEVEVETASPAGGLLVLADQFLPGWQALVDDRETPLLRANFMGRGVIVPAGRHRVLFAYRPAGLTRGCLLATGGLLLWVALLAAARWPAARWPCRRATGPCNIHRAQMCE
jgi:hypothetical protein